MNLWSLLVLQVVEHDTQRHDLTWVTRKVRDFRGFR